VCLKKIQLINQLINCIISSKLTCTEQSLDRFETVVADEIALYAKASKFRMQTVVGQVVDHQLN